MAQLDDEGGEILDPTPVAIPTRLTRPPTIQDQVKQLLAAQRQIDFDSEPESPEEADDFDVGDDYEPDSPYEEPADGFYDHRRMKEDLIQHAKDAVQALHEERAKQQPPEELKKD